MTQESRPVGACPKCEEQELAGDSLASGLVQSAPDLRSQ